MNDLIDAVSEMESTLNAVLKALSETEEAVQIQATTLRSAATDAELGLINARKRTSEANEIAKSLSLQFAKFKQRSQ